MVVRNFCVLVEIFSAGDKQILLKGRHLRSSLRAALVLGTPQIKWEIVYLFSFYLFRYSKHLTGTNVKYTGLNEFF